MKKIKIIKEEDYRKAVLDHYKQYDGGDLSTYLLNPTPAKIKKACKELLRKKNNELDQALLNQFLKEEYNKPGLFKSIQKHLKGETRTIHSEGLELIAVLIDFPYRPFSKYRKHILEQLSEEEEAKSEGESVDETVSVDVIETKELKNPVPGKKIITPKEVGLKKIIKNPIKIGVGVVVIVLLLFGVLQSNFLRSKPCMVWMDTHYEKIDCNAVGEQDFKVPPVAYDEKKFHRLKRIETDQWDTVSFFKEGGSKPNVWYAKTGNRLEFFRADYPHPVTGKALKEITRHIVDEYVFVSIEEHMKKVRDSIRN